MGRGELQIDGGPWKKALRDFDQRTASGDIDHDDQVAWPHASGNDPVVTEASTAEVAAVKGAIRHKAFHCRMRASNLRTRILPVSPKTRMTYCALLRPRMYMLPDDDVPIEE